MISTPYLVTNNKQINLAYRLAIATVAGNIYPYKAGVLEEVKPCLLAGLGYSTPWTRDTAMNVWNAAGLICPDVALNTLKSVMGRDEKGYFIDGEYWDRIIWTIGAWWQYLYTGDKEFLKIAYEAVCNSLEYFENTEFSEELNLFRGAACYGDGVSAYPDIYAAHNWSGIIEFSKRNRELCVDKGVGIPMYTLSTNCLYYYSYVLADKMGCELGLKEKYTGKALKMKNAINNTFWNEEKGTYDYICDNFGGCESQEGLGISFAILFGVADNDKVKKIIKNHKTTEYGIPCVYPSFPRYNTPDGMEFGRHSGTVWPHVQGFWADAVLKDDRSDLFDKELMLQTENALRFYQFAEIYHPISGEMYGGVQENKGKGIAYNYWDCKPCQTWSATAFLRNIYMDFVGLKYRENGIEYVPSGTELADNISLYNLKYRSAVININIIGKGKEIKSFSIDGIESKPFISNELYGTHNIEIELK